MARSLESNPFPKNTRWRNASSWSGVAQSVQKTLGNKVVVFARPDSGMPIDIEISEYAHCTQSDRAWILSLFRQVGQSFVLEWDGATYPVVFRHDEPPAVEFTPVIPTRDESDSKQVFYAIIKLMSL